MTMEQNYKNNCKRQGRLSIELGIDNEHYTFSTSISEALKEADAECQLLNESLETIQKLKPECDKLDYAVAAGVGALCGIIDVFLVAKPGETKLGDYTDKWAANCTKRFANRCGWSGGIDESHDSAVRFLEKKFKVPYDQTGLHDAAKEVFDLSPSNHHFKSLSHNPTLCGLFFAIMDQFANTSHFVTGGELIVLEKASDSFELCGQNIPA